MMTKQVKKPNILFAIADDASHMSAYGHSFVNTPNFDRVAEMGILFKNAFTTNPKCAPSRASILTGKHTWQLEEAGNHYGIFPSKFKVYPDLLEDAGYFVGYTGKGWGPGDYEQGGFERNPAGNEFNDIRLTPPDKTRISNKDYSANFQDFLNKKPDDKPFCFWYGAHEPHRHYEEGEGARAGKSIDTVELPPYFPDNDVVKNDLLDYAYEIEWFDKHLGTMLEKLKERGELENTLIIVTSDNGMPFPRVKGNMYEDDFHLPMALSWGNMTKGSRLVEDLVSFTDIAPTFLDAAGIEIHQQMSGKSLMDIIDSSKSGFINESRDKVYMGRERHDVGRKDDLGYPVRCVRTQEYLYVRNFKPELWPAGNPETGFTGCDSSPTKSLILQQEQNGENYYYDLCFGKRPLEELYNIIEDPACIHNLAKNPEYKELKEEMWEDLKGKLNETQDPRISGNGDIFEEYEYVGYKTHSWKAYQEGWFEKQKY